MTTGEIIKRLLEERNVKQSELARYLGVPANTVNRWMPTENKAGNNPSPYFLGKIAEFFDIPVDYFSGQYDYFNDADIAKHLFDTTQKETAWKNLFEAYGYTITDATDYSQAEKNLSEKSFPMPFVSEIMIQRGNDKRIMNRNEFILSLQKFEKHLRIELIG